MGGSYMQINQLNNCQILCNITIDEINSLGLNKEDFFSGDNHSEAFFSALMDTALEITKTDDNLIPTNLVFNFDDFSNSFNVLIHMNEDTSNLSINEAKDFLNTYRDVIVEDEDNDYEEDLLEEDEEDFVKNYEEYKQAISILIQNSNIKKTTILFKLPKLDEVINVIKRIPKEYKGKSALYRNKNIYYVTLSIEGLNSNEIKVIEFLIADYVEFNYISDMNLAKIKEHYEVIIKENAVEKLQLI